MPVSKNSVQPHQNLIDFISKKYYDGGDKDKLSDKILSNKGEFDKALTIGHQNSPNFKDKPFEEYKKAYVSKNGDPFQKKSPNQGNQEFQNNPEAQETGSGDLSKPVLPLTQPSVNPGEGNVLAPKVETPAISAFLDYKNQKDGMSALAPKPVLKNGLSQSQFTPQKDVVQAQDQQENKAVQKDTFGLDKFKQPEGQIPPQETDPNSDLEIENKNKLLAIEADKVGAKTFKDAYGKEQLTEPHFERQGILESFSKNFANTAVMGAGQGLATMGKLAVDYFPTLSKITGKEEDHPVSDNLEGIRQWFEDNKYYTPTNSQKNIIDNPSDPLAYSALLGQLTGYVVPALSVAKIGQAVNLSSKGLQAAQAMTSLTQNVGMSYQSSKDAGLTDNGAAAMTLVTAPVTTALDMVGMGKILNNGLTQKLLQKTGFEAIQKATENFTKKFTPELAKKAVEYMSSKTPGIVKSATSTGTTEAVVEEGQEGWELSMQAAYNAFFKDKGEDGFNLDDWQKRLVMAPAGGLVGGGVFGTIGGLSPKQRQLTTKKDQLTNDLNKEDAPPSVKEVIQREIDKTNQEIEAENQRAQQEEVNHQAKFATIEDLKTKTADLDSQINNETTTPETKKLLVSVKKTTDNELAELQEPEQLIDNPISALNEKGTKTTEETVSQENTQTPAVQEGQKLEEELVKPELLTRDEFIKTLPTKEVNLDEIISGQDDKYTTNKPSVTEGPIIIEGNRIRDGHHRVNEAKKRGEKTILAVDKTLVDAHKKHVKAAIENKKNVNPENIKRYFPELQNEESNPKANPGTEQKVTLPEQQVSDSKTNSNKIDQEVKTNPYTLSDQLDHNGKKFVAVNDNIDLGTISPETGSAIKREAAPIRLSEGNSSYGLEHIDRDERKDDILENGYDSTEALVDDVAKNYNQIRKGIDGSLLLVKRNGKDKVAYVRLQQSEDGSYYSVGSAGVFRKKYSDKKELLWERSEPISTESGTSDSAIKNQTYETGDLSNNATLQSNSSNNITQDTEKVLPAEENNILPQTNEGENLKESKLSIQVRKRANIPETVHQIFKDNPVMYQTSDQKTVLEQAAKDVEENIDQAISDVLSPDVKIKDVEKTNAKAIVLIKTFDKAAQNAKADDNIELYNELTEKTKAVFLALRERATHGGQGISILNNMPFDTPDLILLNNEAALDVINRTPTEDGNLESSPNAKAEEAFKDFNNEIDNANDSALQALAQKVKELEKKVAELSSIEFKTKKAKIHKKRSEIEERIRKKTHGRANALPVDIIGDYVELGHTYIQEGLIDFEQFAKAMKAAYKRLSGNDADDKLIKEIYEKSKAVEENIKLEKSEKLLRKILGIEPKTEKAKTIVRNIDDILNKHPSLSEKFSKEIAEFYLKEKTKEQEKVLKRYLPSNKAKAAEGKRLIEKVIEMIDNGVFDKDRFKESFGSKYGMLSLSKEQSDIMRSLAEQAKEHSDPDLRDEAKYELAQYIASQFSKSSFGKIAENYYALYYPSILSGETTQIVNIADGIFTTVLNGASTLFSKDARGFIKGFAALFRGFSAGFTRAGVIMKTGKMDSKFIDKKTGKFKKNKSIEEFAKESSKNFNPKNPISYLRAAGYNALKYVPRFMSSVDEVVRTGNKYAYLRMALDDFYRGLGYKGAELSEKIDNDLYGSDAIKEQAKLDGIKEIYGSEKALKDEQGNKTKALKLKRFIDNKLISGINEQILKESIEFSTRTTNQQQGEGTLGLLGKKINGFLQGVPVVKQILGIDFVNTTMNVINKSLNYTPLGFARGHGFSLGRGLDKITGGLLTNNGIKLSEHGTKGSIQREMQIRNATLGSSAFIGLVVFAISHLDDDDESYITGDSGYAKLSDKYIKNKVRPINSIVINGVPFRYTSIPGLNYAMAVAGNLSDYLRAHPNERDPEEIALRTMASMAYSSKVFIDQTPWNRIERVFAQTGQKKDDGEDIFKRIGKYLAENTIGIATAPIAPNAIKQIGKFYDPTAYNPKDLNGYLLKNLGLIQFTDSDDYLVDMWGEKLKMPPGQIHFPVEQLYNEKNKADVIVADADYHYREPSTHLKIYVKDEMREIGEFPYLYKKLVVESGKLSKIYVEELGNDSEFKGMGKKEKQEAIRAAIKSAREYVLSEIIND